MPKVTGFIGVAAALKNRQAKFATSPRCSVVVGYTAAYAIWVHENIEMKWRGFPRDMSIRKGKDQIAYTGYSPQRGNGLFWGPNGQAKFLEGPARILDNTGELARIIMEAMQKGKTIAQALLLAGLRIQRESQKVVPVDTGALKASAFTVLE